MLIFLLYNKSSVAAEMGDRLATINIGRRDGGAVPLSGGGELGPIKHNVAGAEAYLHAKFMLESSNRLATIHQRYRQTEQADNGLIAYGEPFLPRDAMLARY